VKGAPGSDEEEPRAGRRRKGAQGGGNLTAEKGSEGGAGARRAEFYRPLDGTETHIQEKEERMQRGRPN